MKRGRDPAAMTPAERMGAIAALLALGYRRLQIQRQNELDAPPPDERSCEPLVHGTESLGGQEAATGAVPQSGREIA